MELTEISMITAILCDQHGNEFIEGDIPNTKEYKKICSVVDGKVVVKLDEQKIKVISGPTDDTKIVFSNIIDGTGKIKISDIFIVKNF